MCSRQCRSERPERLDSQQGGSEADGSCRARHATHSLAKLAIEFRGDPLDRRPERKPRRSCDRQEPGELGNRRLRDTVAMWEAAGSPADHHGESNEGGDDDQGNAFRTTAPTQMTPATVMAAPTETLTACAGLAENVRPNSPLASR